MAASSPVPSNTSNDTTTTNGTATTAAAPLRSDAPKQNQRGLNKPKCSKCGNVARSRCPFQSCKSCCAKAQNPCHIHVLKANATFPDKTQSSSSPMFDQKSTDVSSTGSGLGFRASMRASSLRQLSNNFAHFDGAQVSRARRPLTRKDAAVINQWRFSKLKEYKERNSEAENEAFDRYMQNVGLLEEAFALNSSLEGPTADVLPALSPTSTSGEDNTQKMISGVKMRLSSDPGRKDGFRQRMRELVDQGLRKFQKWEYSNEGGPANADDVDDEKVLKRLKRTKSWRAERASTVSDLIDKLNKARNEEDLKSCLEMKSQLFSQHEKASSIESKDVDIPKEKTEKEVSVSRQESDCCLPRLFRMAEINQETLQSIDMHFSSLDQVEDL